MNEEERLKIGMYLSTKLACYLGQQINFVTIEHEISYDDVVHLARSALELNLSIFRQEGGEFVDWI